LTLRRVKQELATRELAAREYVTVQLFSSLSRLGTEEAAALIEGWFARTQPAHPDPVSPGTLSVGVPQKSPDQGRDRG